MVTRRDRGDRAERQSLMRPASYQLLGREDARPQQPAEFIPREFMSALRAAAQAAPQASTPQAAEPQAEPQAAPQQDAGGTPSATSARYDPSNPYVAEAMRLEEKYNLPKGVFLALIQQESGFNPNAVSKAGAYGLAQLMPGTASDMGVDPRDPMQNLEGGARYLAEQRKRFGGDLSLALAGYNAGPGAVIKAGNAIPNFPETQKYVAAVMRNAGYPMSPPKLADGGLIDLARKYADGGSVAGSAQVYDPAVIAAIAASIVEPQGYADGGTATGVSSDETAPVPEQVQAPRTFADLVGRYGVGDAMQVAAPLDDQSLGAGVLRNISNYVRPVIQGNFEVPGTVKKYAIDVATDPNPFTRLGRDIGTLGSGIWEGVKNDPLGTALDLLPVVGNVRSAMDADELRNKAVEAEQSGDEDLASMYRQLSSVAVAGAVPLVGYAAIAAKRAASMARDAAARRAGAAGAKDAGTALVVRGGVDDIGGGVGLIAREDAAAAARGTQAIARDVAEDVSSGTDVVAREGVGLEPSGSIARRAKAAARESAQAAAVVPRNLSPSGFYSLGEETAANLAQAKGTPQQFRGMLEKYGVKPVELEGFDEAFAGRPSVTREELAQHFSERRPQVEETVLGGSKPDLEKSWETIDRVSNDLFDAGITEQTPIALNTYDINRYPVEVRPAVEELAAAHRYIREQSDAGRILMNDPPKFQEYTLPGGENYREIALTLPGEEIYRVPDSHSMGEKADVNRIAHIRMSDRTGPNGEKILHLEELQSDWGQKGRTEGFLDPQIKINYDNHIKKLDLATAETKNLMKIASDRLGQANPSFENAVRAVPELKIASDKQSDLYYNIPANPATSGILTAPYVTNTAAWTDLALKRALKEAAEGGYDRVVWTPGVEQANRYGLIDKPREGIISYYDKMVPNQLGKLVKKLDSEARIGRDAIQTQDTPRSMAYFLDWAAARGDTRPRPTLGQVWQNGANEPLVQQFMKETSSLEVPSLTITPKMREAIMKGQTDFAEGGSVQGYADGGSASGSASNSLADLYEKYYGEPTTRQRLPTYEEMGDNPVGYSSIYPPQYMSNRDPNVSEVSNVTLPGASRPLTYAELEAARSGSINLFDSLSNITSGGRSPPRQMAASVRGRDGLPPSPPRPRPGAGAEAVGQLPKPEPIKKYPIEVSVNSQRAGQVDVLPGGRVVFYTPWSSAAPIDQSVRDTIRKQVDQALRPEHDGTFYRLTNNKNEAKLAQSGQLRPSKNYVDNITEPGLSVADGPHYAGQGYKYGYRVRGDVVGKGSDGEPVLNPHTVSVLSKTMPINDLLKLHGETSAPALDRVLQSKGWTREQLREFQRGFLSDYAQGGSVDSVPVYDPAVIAAIAASITEDNYA